MGKQTTIQVDFLGYVLAYYHASYRRIYDIIGSQQDEY